MYKLPARTIKSRTLLSLLVISLLVMLAASSFFYRFFNTANDYRTQQNIVNNMYQREELISSMLQHLGYGHFIHHFKNYVLRKAPEYLEKAERDYRNFKSDFEHLLAITPDEDQLNAILQIQQVISNYHEKLTQLKNADIATLTSSEIDELVKIDDSPAKQALIRLHYSIKKESQLLSQIANAQLQQLYKLVNLGFIFLIFLLFFTGLIYYVMNKLKGSESRLEHAYRYLNQVLNGSKNAVIVLGSDLQIKDVNKTSSTLSGLNETELLQTPILQLLPKLSEEDELTHQKLKQQSQQDNIPLTLCTELGDEKDVDVSVSIIGTDDSPLYLLMIRDVGNERQLTQNLLENQKMLNQSQTVAQFGSWFWDLSSNNIVWSEAAEVVYGLSKRELSNSFNSIVTYVHPEDKDMVVDAIQNTVVLKSDFNLSYRLIIDDQIRYIQEVGKAYVDQQGEVTSILGTVRDVTLEREINEQLAMSESVFSHAQEGIFVTDGNRKIQRINAAFTRITGYDQAQAIGKSPEQLLRCEQQDNESYHKFWSNQVPEGEWKGEIWDKNANGELILTAQYITAVLDDNGNVVRYLAIISDITKKRELEDIIRQKAYFDALTALPNRSLFLDRLKVKVAEAKRHEQRFALCFMDLDGFKAINDTHGHNVGDKVLIETANRLSSAVRESDTVSRLAGDEFTLILDNINTPEVAIEKVEHLIKLVNLPILHDGLELQVGASVGIKIVYGEENLSLDELLRQSDHAMYQAKEAGKNQAFMHSGGNRLNS